MNTKPSKQARREAARHVRQRRQRIKLGSAIGAILVAIGAVVLIGGSSDQTSAMAPDFALESAEGDTITLSDYRGQPVALTFMHTY